MRHARKIVPPITPPAMAPALTLDVLEVTVDVLVVIVDTAAADDDVVPIVAAGEGVPVMDIIGEVVAVVGVVGVTGSEDAADWVSVAGSEDAAEIDEEAESVGEVEDDVRL